MNMAATMTRTLTVVLALVLAACGGGSDEATFARVAADNPGRRIGAGAGGPDLSER